MMSICMQANFKIAQHIREIGIPMRMLKANGKLENEIKSIQTNVTLADEIFEMPRSYKLIR